MPPVRRAMKDSQFPLVTFTSLPPGLEAAKDARTRSIYGWEGLKLKQGRIIPKANRDSAYISMKNWNEKAVEDRLDHEGVAIYLASGANTDKDGKVIKVPVMDGDKAKLNRYNKPVEEIKEYVFARVPDPVHGTKVIKQPTNA